MGKNAGIRGYRRGGTVQISSRGRTKEQIVAFLFEHRNVLEIHPNISQIIRESSEGIAVPFNKEFEKMLITTYKRQDQILEEITMLGKESENTVCDVISVAIEFLCPKGKLRDKKYFTEKTVIGCAGRYVVEVLPSYFKEKVAHLIARRDAEYQTNATFNQKVLRIVVLSSQGTEPEKT